MSSLSFTKLFSSITDSSVWQESDQTRLVWITMLAMADPLGRIHAAVPGLAHRARVSLADTQAALALFLAPDAYSRTTEHDGRRIEVIAGGWQLLNYQMYRDKRDPEARKEQNRIAQDKYRTRNSKPIVSQSKPASAKVSQNKPQSAQEEVEVEVERTNTNTLASSSNELPAAPRKLVCTLPLIQGPEHQVFDDEVMQWQAIYLAVDVRQELRNLKGWLIGNPKLRKTKNGIGRFINSWLSRAQNEAKPNGGGSGTFKGKSGHSIDAARAAIEEIENSHAPIEAWSTPPSEAGQGRLPDLCGGSGEV